LIFTYFPLETKQIKC